MNQEDEKLLLIDLSSRLSYGVQIHIDFINNGHIVGDATLESIKAITGILFDFVDFKQDFKHGECVPINGFSGHKLLKIGDFKPYLRSISSMTEGEKHELYQVFQECPAIIKTFPSYAEFFIYADIINSIDMANVIDWLNAHHFDYRGLIGKGLAIEAPKGMYKFG